MTEETLINKKKNTRKKLQKKRNMNSTEEFETTQEINTIEEIIIATTTTNNNINTEHNYIPTPAQKRLRDDLNNSHLGSVCKTPRLTTTESSLKIITIMDKRFDKLTNVLETMIIDKINLWKEELLSEFDKSFTLMKKKR